MSLLSTKIFAAFCILLGLWYAWKMMEDGGRNRRELMMSDIPTRERPLEDQFTPNPSKTPCGHPFGYFCKNKGATQ